MKNNLYEKYGNQQQLPQNPQNPQSGMPDPFGSMGGLRNQWVQFRNGYSGNAQQEVQRLMQSGKMSPQQFNMYRAMAQRIAPFLFR